MSYKRQNVSKRHSEEVEKDGDIEWREGERERERHKEE